MVSNLSFGQVITGVDAFESGNNIVIEYNIESDGGTVSGDRFAVVPSFSTDGGKTYTELRSVSGDLENVPAGTGNRIVWRVMEDYREFVHPQVIFKVEFKTSESGDAQFGGSTAGDDYFRKGIECEKEKRYADAIKYYRLASKYGNKEADARIRALQLHFW